MLTLRDIQVLHSVVRYRTLTRAQINRLHFPDDDDGRLTRRRLQVLIEAKLIDRAKMEVSNPTQGAPAPVYFPLREGFAFLAQETGHEAYRNEVFRTPQWQHLYHFVDVAETHILFDRAIERTPGVSLVAWYGETSVLNADEHLPEKRYRLYTRLNERIVCVPDAGMLLEKAAHRKVFYLEQDRDTTKNADRVAAQKHAGYHLLSERSGHRVHFPTATIADFTVLMIAPTPRRRDALKNAFSRTAGAMLWRFASKGELTPDTLLHSPVWHACDGSVSPLLKPPGDA